MKNVVLLQHRTATITLRKRFLFLKKEITGQNITSVLIVIFEEGAFSGIQMSITRRRIQKELATMQFYFSIYLSEQQYTSKNIDYNQ